MQSVDCVASGSAGVSAVVDPRVKWVPRGRRTKLGREAVEFNAAHGLVLDDWQAMVLSESLRIESKTATWRSFEVGVDLSRQNGKGGIIEGRQLPGLFLLREPLQVYSSHQFDTSLEAFRRLLELVEGSGELSRQVKRVARSHGEEGIELFAKHGELSGPRIRFRTRTKGGGRGFSCDCLYLDEAMVISEAMHGALLPTLSARRNPQVWYLGSPVDQLVHEHGVVFARVRERGRKGGDPALSWYEWSAPAEHPDEITPEMAADPEVWRMANPALGTRIRESLVANEQRSMDPRTFAVERLGVGDWPATTREGATVVDLREWMALADPASVLADPVVLAFDVSPDRRAAIAAAGRSTDGFWHVEIPYSQAGTRWLLERLPELKARHSPARIVCDGYGHAAALIAPLEELGVEVEPLTTSDLVRSCSRFVEFVEERELRHLGSPELIGAIRAAKTRPLGDAWAWSRKVSTGNISPLVAGTLALSAAVEHRQAEPAKRSWRVA